MRHLLICKAAFFFAVFAFVGRAGFTVLAACPAAAFAGKWAAFSAASAGGVRARFSAFGVRGLASGGRQFWRSASAAWRRTVLAFWPYVLRRLAIQNAIARLQSQWFLFDGGGELVGRSLTRLSRKPRQIRIQAYLSQVQSYPKIGRQTIKNGQKWLYQRNSGKSIQAPTKRLCKTITPAAYGGGSEAWQDRKAAAVGGGLLGG